MPVCSNCSVDQPLVEFHKSSAHKSGHNPWCRSCFNERRRAQTGAALEAKQKRDREYYHKPGVKERVRERQMYAKYGLLQEEYDEMVHAQQNKCGVCDEDMTKPCVDHCHDTGKVRGLLCSNCNAALGLLKDDPDVVLSAAKYLQQYKARF